MPSLQKIGKQRRFEKIYIKSKFGAVVVCLYDGRVQKDKKTKKKVK